MATNRKGPMSYAPTCPRCQAPFGYQGNTPGTPVICGKCGASFPPGALSGAANSPPPFNPYAPPTSGNPFADAPLPGYLPSGYVPPVYDPASIRRIARGKVQGPAILLIVSGVLAILGSLGLVGLAIAMAMEDSDAEAQIIAAVLIICAVLSIGCSGIIVFAGVRMRQLRSYALAMTATVLLMLVGFMICLPAILAGIWPLVVLLDAQVKLAFKLPPTEDEM